LAFTSGKSLQAALQKLIREPGRYLVQQWNWKSALTSSLTRGLLFLFANLTAGWRAAVGAMTTEWIFRAITSGFYGSITQTLGEVEPAWQGSLVAMFLLPLISHSMEFGVHYLRGTAKLKTSIIASIVFTMFSTLFNVYAMRRGTMVVGKGTQSLVEDMKGMPRMLAGFVTAVPRQVLRTLRDRLA
jgi:hypothetical protein